MLAFHIIPWKRYRSKSSPSNYEYIAEQARLFSPDMATGLSKGNPVKLYLKTGLVSHQACGKEVWVSKYLCLICICSFILIKHTSDKIWA